jgi:hypothetical protein
MKMKWAVRGLVPGEKQGKQRLLVVKIRGIVESQVETRWVHPVVSKSRGKASKTQIREDDHEIVDYEDEMGRTRTGTRREAREAETARRKDPRNRAAEQTPQEGVGDQSSYAEVM